jgi:two-component system nitrate/nitrite response regulator NarL
MSTTSHTSRPLVEPLPELARVDDLAPVLERVRVLIAEDHPLYREAIARAIAGDPRLELVGQAADGEEAYALAAELEPDVLVLDQRMPLLDGIGVCERLQRHDPPPATAVLMLSAYDESDIVWRAVTHGAAGYLGKDASAEQIRDAIGRLADGRLAFTDRTGRAVNQGFDRLLGRTS